jgi:hypothetical protein
MKEQRFLKSFFFFGAALTIFNLLFYFSNQIQIKEDPFLVQNTYMGPTSPVPGNPYLVRVEILVRDSPDMGGVQIQNVSFDGKEIPLKPRDILGKRASASFQLAPGNYTLRWTVEKDKVIWPRTISHEEMVIISPRDLWIQILIEGDKATIS